MKPSYLGDSYDIVKQSLLRWLGNVGDWSTHPMFTEQVTAKQADDFAHLIGTRLLSAEPLTNETNRSAYLSPANECGTNIFLDPDTGVRLKSTRGKKAPFYLFGHELVEIVKSHPNRLVMVFDQSLPRGSERQQLHNKLQAFSVEGLHSFAYVSHACFIFLGIDKSLLESAFKVILKESRLPISRFLTENLQSPSFQ